LACRRLVIARQKSQVCIVARFEGVEQRNDARHDPLARTRLVEIAAEMREVHLLEGREMLDFERNAAGLGRGGQNARVRAARHLDVAKGVRHGEHVLERTRHRAHTGAAGENQRPVDVEEQNPRHRLAGHCSVTSPSR